MDPISPQAQVRFLGDLQRLLSEGGFVATYKFALLLALADLAVEGGDDSDATLELSSRDIAEKIIHYYWRQAAPYFPAGATRGAVLHQNTGRQASILVTLGEAHKRFQGSLPRVQADVTAWRRLVSQVARVVQVMPLWKLQTFGNEQVEFLYENTGRGSTIVLKPGVAFCLRRFHDLVHDLVTGAWLRHVRSIKSNQSLLGATTDLAEFMFGSERNELSAYVPILTDVQDGRCFYCQKRLGKGPQVDHFIPWRLYPVDLGHNFVLADSTCNNRKRDLLAAVDHLERWCRRNEDRQGELLQAYRAAGIVHDLESSWSITRWAYAQTDAIGGRVWQSGKEVVPLDPAWRGLPGMGKPPPGATA